LNKYEEEILKSQKLRDNLITKKVGAIFDVIRDKSQKLAMEVTIAADGNDNYFQEYNRSEKFATKTNKTLRPEYLKKDGFSKERYIEEYRTTYFESLYTITNEGISDGYLVKLPRYSKKQFKQAINYPLSKLMNTAKMKTGRSVDIEQIYTSIVSGVEQGLSLKNINRQIDIDLGYRDPQTGKWLKNVADRKGQTYKTQRVLRTEVLRMRSTAETDQWINQQDIVPSKLQLIEVLDDRTRGQSAQMDGQISNKEGQFLYPNGQYAYAHRSGVAKWDINDRSTTITLDPDFPPETRIVRDPKTGENKVQPFQSFKEYAENNNLKRNIYGEYLFANG
jgi:hypothetical protein